MLKSKSRELLEGFKKKYKLQHDSDTAGSTKNQKSIIVIVVLSVLCFMSFANRLYSVINFESIIHEFDPWFNYRGTHYMNEFGFRAFMEWFDTKAWYPIGRMIGPTVFPGIMVTSTVIQHVLSFFRIPIHIREICVFLGPIFSSFTVLATYLLTKEIWNKRAGMLAALFISIIPGYISRSVAGSYDNEAVAICALVTTFMLWIKSLKYASPFYAVLCALSYYYMVGAWGGYVFIINLIPLHVFVVLIAGGGYSKRLYVSYCVFYVFATLLSIHVPFVSLNAIKNSEHLAALGVFGLLQFCAFYDYIMGKFGPTFKAHPDFKNVNLKKMLIGFFSGIIVLAVIVLIVLEMKGYVAKFTGRFYSLFDTKYAKVHIPIIASVAEHQPTVWTSFFLDLHLLTIGSLVGIYVACKYPTDGTIFTIVYGMSASYFAGVMVRLILTLSPIICILAAIGISHVIDCLLETDQPPNSIVGGKKVQDGGGNETTGMSIVSQASLLVIAVMLMLFVSHSTWMTVSSYSGPTVILSTYNNNGDRMILDDFREAYYWMNRNTGEHETILSWWDYGYQIAGFSNRTTIVDNNTSNNTHIAVVGRVMASNESEAYKILKDLNANYLLVIFGGMIGYSGDDINKFLWMVRIAQGEFPQHIRESDYFSNDGRYTVGKDVSKVFRESLMYKMCYYRFGEMRMFSSRPAGYDVSRQEEIGHKNIRFDTLEEVFTSKNWLVRIYKVKDYENRQKFSSRSQIRV